MINELKKELVKRYKCDFAIKETNEIFEIIYNDESFIDNEKFIDDVIDLSENYLNEEQFWKLAISYDYLEEIDCKNQLEISKECEFQDVNSETEYAYNLNSVKKGETIKNTSYDVIKESLNKRFEFLGKVTEKIVEIVFENKKINEINSTEYFKKELEFEI